MRRRYTRGLQQPDNETEEEYNPMSFMANVSDCMLVVAVGLLVAMVAHYGLDLNEQTLYGKEVDLGTPGIEGESTVEGIFVEEGTVYQNAETGEYYLVTKQGGDN